MCSLTQQGSEEVFHPGASAQLRQILNWWEGSLALAAIGPRPSAGENVHSGTHGVQWESGLGFVASSFQALFGHSCADFLPFLLLCCLCGHCCHSPAVLAVGSVEGFPWQGLGKSIRPRVAPCYGPRLWAAGFSQRSHERCSPAACGLLKSKRTFWQQCCVLCLLPLWS